MPDPSHLPSKHHQPLHMEHSASEGSVVRAPDAVSAAPATAATAAAGATRKRKRHSVGSTDEYEELCTLGEGGFGAVVKARHRFTGKTVAIKRLLPDPDSDDARTAEEELLREARVHQQCDGIPSVVAFHGLLRDPATNDLCLVMECAGPSLHHLLRARRRRHPGEPLPESTVKSIMYQLLTAAKMMHERNVVHRDIKLENVLLADDYRVLKICDFGLAMSMAEAPPYEPAGTLCHEAPEMLLEIPEYDALVDTWSLGCVMAELITGRALFGLQGCEDAQLFAAESRPELELEKHSHLRKRFPEEMLSEQGFEVLNGLLTCNPGKRLTAAAALKLPWFAKVDALELPKEEVPSAVPKPKEKEPLVVPQDSAKRRKLLSA
ncbi:hypothetical protein ACP4OV_008686 [Aristida adscensionis]